MKEQKINEGDIDLINAAKDCQCVSICMMC